MQRTSKGMKKLRMLEAYKTALNKVNAKIEKYYESISNKTSDNYAVAYALYSEQLPNAKQSIKEANLGLSRLQLIILENQADSALRKKLELLEKQELLNIYRFLSNFLFS
jgi:hypothetical protein